MRHYQKFSSRDSELTRLREFLDTPAQLRWWQVAGAGGQGKSRLAMELVLELDSAWHGGFLRTDLLSETDWKTVHSARQR